MTLFGFGIVAVKKLRHVNVVTLACGCRVTHFQRDGLLSPGGTEDGRNPHAIRGAELFELHLKLGSHHAARVQVYAQWVERERTRLAEAEARLAAVLADSETMEVKS